MNEKRVKYNMCHILTIRHSPFIVYAMLLPGALALPRWIQGGLVRRPDSTEELSAIDPSPQPLLSLANFDLTNIFIALYLLAGAILIANSIHRKLRYLTEQYNKQMA